LFEQLPKANKKRKGQKAGAVLQQRG